MGLSESAGTIESWLKTSRIITGSLITGVTMFGIITLVLRSGKGPLYAPGLDLTSPLVLVGLAVAASAVMLLVVFAGRGLPLPRDRVKAARTREERVDELLKLEQTQLIVRCAILEGAAFLNLVVFLLEGPVLNLITAGVLILLMIMQFPTRGKVEAAIEAGLQGDLI